MVTLVASGGHTALIRVDDRATFSLLGQTLDDAAGEAFDKGAGCSGSGYPGGQRVGRARGEGGRRCLLLSGRTEALGPAGFLLLRSQDRALLPAAGPGPGSSAAANAADVAASYREAIVDALVSKSVRTAGQQKVRTLAVAGGVAANSLLRRRLREAGAAAGFHVVIPPLMLLHRQRRHDRGRSVGRATGGVSRLPRNRRLGVAFSGAVVPARALTTSRG